MLLSTDTNTLPKPISTPSKFSMQQDGSTEMPKRQKAKPATTKPIEKPVKKVSIKNRQQLENEAKNKAIWPELKPWEKVRKARHDERKARGLTYDNWRRNNSARSETPNASNTLTERTDKVGRVARDNRRGGQIKSKVADGATYSSHEVNRY